MHKQTGYNAAKLDPRHKVAILHNTAICQLKTSDRNAWATLILNTGGWNTRSTTKAMNGFLKDNNINWRVRIRKGQVEAVRIGQEHEYFVAFTNDQHVIELFLEN